jgi:putative hydrolase of the HAD superfamily
VEVTAVLFDMGGTLLGYAAREELGRPTVDALQRLGFSLGDPAVRAARRRAFEEVERRYATRPSFLHRDLFRDQIARTAELLGVTAPDDLLDRFDAEQLQAVIEHLAPMPGVHEALAGLRARGLYLGVVSNADDDHLAAVLERNGLDVLVDHWTSSEEADSCKPDPRIYRHALAKAGRTPAETLFVGDSPQHDVAGAQRAGMRAALIGEPGTVAPLSSGLEAGRPDFEVRALLELLPIVDGCNSR